MQLSMQVMWDREEVLVGRFRFDDEGDGLVVSHGRQRKIKDVVC